LCDAVIIIDAHNLGIEAQYFKDDLQVKHYLDFKKDIASGKIIKISMPIEEIQTAIKKACENRLDIQAGEAESIAALLKPRISEIVFLYRR
jgi:hypothetical protein